MQTSEQFRSEAELLLDEIGGEPLAGSGFETEQSDEAAVAEESAL